MSDWQKTYLKGAVKSARIDRETGIIRDVVMCQVGEAKGHGVHLEKEFIERVVSLAEENRQGLKARFGHPSMSDEALGKGLGRFQNPRLRGNQAIADLHLANYAKESPDGDLHSYVIARATEDPDSFGSSIVFTPGKKYQRNKKGEKIFRFTEEGKNEEWDSAAPVYVEIASLHNCDLVDEGAATDSLFHAKYNSHAFAVRLTQFLDQNPDIDTFLDEHEALEEKIQEFIAKRRELKAARETRPDSEIMNETEKKSIFQQLAALREKVFGAAPEAAEPEVPAEDPRIAELTTENAALRDQLQAEMEARAGFQAQFAALEAEVKQLAARAAAPAVAAEATTDLTAGKGEVMLSETQYAIEKFERRKKFKN